jgi:hypothetical protein
MVPPPVSLFDLLKFLPLFVGKIGGDLLVRFRHDLMDAPAGVAPYLLELRSRFIDNRPNLSHLFRCQSKLRAKPFLHSVAHASWAMDFKEEMPSVQSPQCSASDSTGDEYKDKSSNKFPL